MHTFGVFGSSRRAWPVVVVLGLTLGGNALGQAPSLPGKNVNAIGPAYPNWLYPGDPRMQHNESDGTCSPNNPDWCAIGMNDYRGVNDPAIGDTWQGIAMTRNGGLTWASGMNPANLAENPNINQKFAADPNLEAVPGMLFYNFIAGWRDGSFPGGVYLQRWYEHNREVGPPWEYKDTLTVQTGTSGRFLDKPAFLASYRNPAEPDIVVPIPALPDPANPSQNLHEAYDLVLPPVRLHLCYAVFVGNDNNDGTKIECTYSDDAGVTWSGKTKLTESKEINQGVSLATRNNGLDMFAAWLQFKDDVNDSDAIMYAYSSDGGETWSKAEQITQFCPFNQPTGPARHRTNALPVAVSNGVDFAVYFASRNTPTGQNDTCIIPGKGNQEGTPAWSNVAFEDDHDSFGEPVDADGNRIRDGLVRTSLNYSRIMMVRSSNPSSKNSWSEVVAIDPQLRSDVAECQGQVQGTPVECRRNGHQYMPAAFAAKGIETIAYYDSRLDRLNRLQTPITSGFVGDIIAAFKSDTVDPDTGEFLPPWNTVTLLPAEVYELEPPPAAVPSPGNNIPLRRNIDVFAVQVGKVGNGYEPLEYLVNPETFYPDASASLASPSVRVTRFATRLKRDGLGNIINDPLTGKPAREQAQYNFPNARMFAKGTRPFIGDYNTVFAVNARLENGQWVSNQSAIDPSAITPDSPLFFSSRDPEFHIGWTSNRDVRGKVFYTGCDEWDETLQMWVASDNCANEYVVPGVQQDRTGAMAPLQGADGSPGSPPGQCVAVGSADALQASFKGPLTRNQNIYTAVMKPGLNVEVVSAIKDRDSTGSVLNTFVLAVNNATRLPKRVRIVLPEDDVTVSFDKATFESGAPRLASIDVSVPAGSSNVRTAFDSAGDLTTPVPVLVYDVTALPPNTDPGPAELFARVALERDTVLPLEPVVSDTFGDNIIDLEYFEVLLTRETGAEKTLDFENLDFENLDFENDPQLLDFENSAELLDFENLDFENTLIFLDFENTTISNVDLLNDAYSLLDFENLDFENTVTLLDFENLDFENRTMFLDFENLDFENRFIEALDFENLDFENLDFENLDFENLDFENNAQLLDFENLDFENLDFENSPLFASEVKNQDLETLDLDAPLNQESVEVTWAASSESNTTTGVDIKPIFSPALVQALEQAGSKVILSVRQAYYTSTVSLTSSSNFCTVQVVADNQILYSAVLDPSQINSLFDDPDASEVEAPAFRIDPDGRVFITLQIVNPPSQFTAAEDIDRAIGLGIYAQGLGNTQPCVENQEVDGTVDYESCDIDPFEQDQEPPEITLLGDNPDTVEVTQVPGADYADPGFTAIDDFDGDITADVTVTGNVDVSALGTYEISYTVSDAVGNEATATRTVNVVDNTPPTVTAPADITTEANASLTTVALGDAVAADNSGSVTVSSDAAANFPSGFPVGISTVIWTATDGGGRQATAVQNIVITDTTAPSIILNTVNEEGVDVVNFTLEAGQVYAEPGAMVADLADPAPMLVISGSVDSTTAGPYTITYTATDATATNADGTPATTANVSIVTRTITVIDTTDPTITSDVPPPLTPDPATAIIEPPDSTLTISWPITAADEGSFLALSCTINSAIALNPSASSYDPDTGILEASFDYPFPAGETIVNCTATDQSGLTVSTGDFPVFVEDEPIIDETTLPATLPFVIDANSTSGYSGPAPWDPILADDGVDGDDGIVADCSPTTDLPLGDSLITCTATDSAGNESAPVTFTVTVRFPYDIVIEEPKRNINAGSAVPIDWSYTLPGTNSRVDTSGFGMLVEWFGPFANRNGCSGTGTGSSDGSTAADDTGSSDFRYSDSDDSWRLNWDTPSAGGYYRVVISPPGDISSTICVRLR